MPQPILYDSFSQLVRMICDGRAPDDSPESVYFFQMNFDLQGMAGIINNRGLSTEQVDYLIERLCQATMDDRVFWRDSAGEGYDSRRDSFVMVVERLRLIDPNVPRYNPSYSSAWYNPSVRAHFFGSSVIDANRF